MSVTVTGDYKTPDGKPASGSVRFTLRPAAVDDNATQRTAGPVIATLDSTGAFTVDLVADDDLAVSGYAIYQVSERVTGLVRSWNLYLDGTENPVDLQSKFPGTGFEPGAVVPVPGEPGPQGEPGPPGPGNTLTVGTVQTSAPGGAADASITGASPDQTLNLVLPQGQPGPKGDPGSAGGTGGTGPAGPANTLTVTGTATLTPGTPAYAQITGVSPAQNLAFGIPQGTAGAAGAAGAAATVAVGSTVTVSPGSNATVSNVGSSSAAVLNFGIPQGIQGAGGPQGETGPQGGQGPQGVQGVPGPASDLTKAKADVLYEGRSELLREALWHVDAGVLTGDGLALDDLTGRGRPAVFGVGAAKPVVLPWTGEDYLYVAGGGVNYATIAAASVPLTSTMTLDVVGGGEGNYYYQQDPAVGGFLVQSANANLIVGWDKGGQVYESVTFAGAVPAGRHKIVLAVTATGVTATVDGAGKGTLTFPTVRPAAPVGGWYVYGSSSFEVYSITIGTHILDPRNVSADYATITNTGTAGGTWTITRAASGYKTAVVDRPLILFGGAQTAVATGLPKSVQGTVLAAVRHHGVAQGNLWRLTTGGIASGDITAADAYLNSATIVNAIWVVADSGTRADFTTGAAGQHVYGARLSATAFNGLKDGAVASTDTSITPGAGMIYNGFTFPNTTMCEYLAVAVWDRALTDAEIAQVSQELAGVPHEKQVDPHENYALRSTVGNLLTDNQAGCVSGFTSSATLVYSGGSLTQTMDATTTQTLSAGAQAMTVVGGMPYTLRVDITSIVGRSHRFRVDWHDSGGALITAATSAVQRAAGFTGRAQEVLVSPVNAAKATVYLNAPVTGSIGDALTLTKPGFWRGAGGNWSMPGTPIVNLGIQTGTDGVTQAWDTVSGSWVKVEDGWETVATWSALPASSNWPGRQIKVADGLGLLVAVWDGTAWAVDPVSDTGWHTITGLLNGWTYSGTAPRIRRAGRLVDLEIRYRMDGTAATADAFWALPTGWRRPQGNNSYGVIRTSTGSTTLGAVNSPNDTTFQLWNASRSSANDGHLSWLTDNAWPTSAPA